MIDERGVHAEDLRPGDHVTVYRLHCGQPSPFIGMALTVLAVDLPFVAIRAAAFGCHIGLDSREIEFKRLSPEYVAAMTTAPASPTSGTETQPEPSA